MNSPVADIPVYGTISAGFAEERFQEARECLSIDVERLGIRATARTFALEVKGDSMIGRHIMRFLNTASRLDPATWWPP